MRYLWVLFAVAAIIIVFTAVSLRAQGGGGALVVATCGTLPQAYVAGATRRITVNTNGQVCQ